MPTPDSYSRTQIWLHWVVVVGILVQFAISESIVNVMAALRLGEAPVPADVTLADAHALIGTVILVAMFARLWFRFSHGVPGHPVGTPSLQGKLASLVHAAFYVLLLAMVVTGILTKNEVVNLGAVHFGVSVTIFFLALGHGAVAIFNQFSRKDGTLSRMNPFARNDH